MPDSRPISRRDALRYATAVTAVTALAGMGAADERPELVYFLHDEVIVHAPEHLADQSATAVRDAARAAGELLFGTFPVEFPLDVAVVGSYDEAT